MTELALHILDIAKNSVRAHASRVEILVDVSSERNLLTVSVSDNGCGMSDELKNSVTDPFSTTRKTRKVGLGIPLFKQAAETTGGEFSLESELGVGTTTTATFVLDSIDRVPLGDVAGTMTTLIGGDEHVDYVLTYRVDGREYVFDSARVREIMEGIPLSTPEVLGYIEDMIAENIENINGGIDI